MRYLTARLMPTWRDTLEEQQQQFPALSAVSVSEAEVMQHQRPISEELSFFQWLRALNINPTGAAQNLVTAMQKLSVSKWITNDALQQAPAAVHAKVEV